MKKLLMLILIALLVAFSIFLFISLLFIQTPTNTRTIITYLRKKES